MVVDVVLVALVVLVARVVEVPCVEEVVLVVMRMESLRAVSSLVVPVVEVVVSCDSSMGTIVFLANPSAAMEPAMQATIKSLFFIMWRLDCGNFVSIDMPHLCFSFSYCRSGA